MNVQTNTQKAKAPKKEFNLGDTVTWSSHANGKTRTKTGKIIAVMSPNTNYRRLKNLPKNLYVRLLRERGYTRDEARNRVDSYSYSGFYETVFNGTYRLKFRPDEGMVRDEYHYLIEVEAPPGRGSTPRLYHPKTHLLQKV